MSQPDRRNNLFQPGSRRNEISSLGRERFTELTKRLSPIQLAAIKKTHEHLEEGSNIIIFTGTIMSVGSSFALRLTQNPELLDGNNIAFGVLTLIGGYFGAVGVYTRSAAREGISIINSRLR